MIRRAVTVWLILGVVLSSSAWGQRREGRRAPSVLVLELPVCVVFGEKTLPARRYRLTVGKDSFALTDPETMVFVAKIPFRVQTLSTAQKKPSVKVKQEGRTVVVEVRYGDRVLRAEGKLGEKEAADPTLVVLAGKRETEVESRVLKKVSDQTQAEHAIKRYFGGIKHCVDKVHRSRWGTDDPRFYDCVCPIALKWRMPKVSKALVVHYPLAKGRSGFSLWLTPAGKITRCRVWVGLQPPPDPAASSKEAPSPQTPPPAQSQKAP